MPPWHFSSTYFPDLILPSSFFPVVPSSLEHAFQILPSLVQIIPPLPNGLPSPVYPLVSSLSHLSCYQGSPLFLWHWFFITICFPPLPSIYIFLTVLHCSLYVYLCLAPLPLGFLITGAVSHFFVPSSAPTASAGFICIHLLASSSYKSSIYTRAYIIVSSCSFCLLRNTQNITV